MTAFVCRGLPRASPGTVERAMRASGLMGVRRVKRVRTTVATVGGNRAADLLDREALIVDVFAQRIVAWHAATLKVVDLVMTTLRMAVWQRNHEGHPIAAGELIHDSDTGPQYTAVRFTEHLALEGSRPSSGSVGDAYDTR